MTWLRRLRDTIVGSRLEQTLDEETRFHLEQRTKEYVHRGMTVDEARNHALRRFGNVTLTKREPASGALLKPLPLVPLERLTLLEDLGRRRD